MARCGHWVVALGLVVAGACSSDREFSGNQAGGDGGTDENVDAGGMAENVGGSGAVGAGASNAGEPNETAGSAAVGEAGSGNEVAGLTILSVSPEDGADAVERDAPVQVTFSAPVDADSVTAETFKVSGPRGAITGKLRVTDAVVSFKPDAPWALLTDYSVEITTSIMASDEKPLEHATKCSFQSRDGVFRKPERLAAIPANLGALRGNAAGHVVAQWTDRLTPVSSFAATLDPRTGKWSAVTRLENFESGYGVNLDINADGDILGVSSAGAWIRRTGDSWSALKTTGIALGRWCVLADDGSAMTFGEDSVGGDHRVFAAAISPDDKWSPIVTLGTKARAWTFERYGNGYIAIYSKEPDYRVFYRTFNDGAWAAEKPLTPSATPANYIGIDSRDGSVLFTWVDPKNRMQASLFDGTAWTTQDLGPAAGGTYASLGSTGAIAAWIDNMSSYLAVYDPASGWADPVRLGTTSPSAYALVAKVDSSGNVLAAWPEGGHHITWRRLVHGATDWSEPDQLKDQDPNWLTSTIDAAGNVMLVWDNPLGVWATRFE